MGNSTATEIIRRGQSRRIRRSLRRLGQGAGRREPKRSLTRDRRNDVVVVVVVQDRQVGGLGGGRDHKVGRLDAAVVTSRRQLDLYFARPGQLAASDRALGKRAEQA